MVSQCELLMYLCKKAKDFCRSELICNSWAIGNNTYYRLYGILYVRTNYLYVYMNLCIRVENCVLSKLLQCGSVWHGRSYWLTVMYIYICIHTHVQTIRTKD